MRNSIRTCISFVTMIKLEKISFLQWFSKKLKRYPLWLPLLSRSNPAIHGVWFLPVDQFKNYLHKKYSFGDNIQFDTNWLIRFLNKLFPNQSLEPNEVAISQARRWLWYFDMSIKQRAKLGQIDLHYRKEGISGSQASYIPVYSWTTIMTIWLTSK